VLSCLGRAWLKPCAYIEDCGEGEPYRSGKKPKRGTNYRAPTVSGVRTLCEGMGTEIGGALRGTQGKPFDKSQGKQELL